VSFHAKVWKKLYSTQEPRGFSHREVQFADNQLLYWEGVKLTKNIDNWTERYNNLLNDFKPPEDWFEEKLPSEVKSEFISLLEQLLNQ
jgi:hypothetical protein